MKKVSNILKKTANSKCQQCKNLNSFACAVCYQSKSFIMK